jgi:cytochrome c peroxidase
MRRSILLCLTACSGSGALVPVVDAGLDPLRASLRELSPQAFTVPADPTNRWADDPKAAALGQRLFFDPTSAGNM